MARSESIYAHVLPHLAPRPVEDQSKQDKIDVVKATIDNIDPYALAEEYVRLRSEELRIKAEASELDTKMQAFEQLLIASQDNCETGWGQYGVKPNALRLPDGSTIRVQPEPYCSVADKEAFRLWCIANGYENQLQLWPSRMASIVKERLVAGEELPAGTNATAHSKVIFVAKTP